MTVPDSSVARLTQPTKFVVGQIINTETTEENILSGLCDFSVNSVIKNSEIGNYLINWIVLKEPFSPRPEVNAIPCHLRMNIEF